MKKTMLYTGLVICLQAPIIRKGRGDHCSERNLKNLFCQCSAPIRHSVQAYLKDMVSLVLAHCNKVNFLVSQGT